MNNVRSVILHQDEGIPHLHAFIIPVDEKGVLNASYYIGGMQRCSRLQSSYAEKMHSLGLERGEERSPASHKDIGRYHNRINKAVSRELPEPMRGESLEAFRERGNACLQDAELTYLSERTRLEQEVVKAQASVRRMNAENQAVHKQMERIAEILGCDRIDEEAVRVLRNLNGKVYTEEEANTIIKDMGYTVVRTRENVYNVRHEGKEFIVFT